ncbi:hypothetical protein SDJN02_14975, partial [Cucurbita argyrosperma subsp. argyrosperma]
VIASYRSRWRSVRELYGHRGGLRIQVRVGGHLLSIIRNTQAVCHIIFQVGAAWGGTVNQRGGLEEEESEYFRGHAPPPPPWSTGGGGQTD